MKLFKFRGLFAGREYNQYLLNFDYYNSFDKEHFKHYGKYPELPYSLTGILQQKHPDHFNVFVCRHGSTAHWFANLGNQVILGRKNNHPDSSSHSKVQYVENYKSYQGPDIDLLVVDSRHALDAVSFFYERLSSQAVVLIAIEEIDPCSDRSVTLFNIHDLLSNKHWKTLTFKNPGPGHAVMTGELWYRPGNCLGI